MRCSWNARCLLLGLALAGCLAGAGCSGLFNPFAIPALLFGMDKIDPKVKLLKDRRSTAKILVLSYANSDLRWGNDSIDEELTAQLSVELASEDRFKLVPERKLRQWRDEHPRWESKPLQSIGEDFGVDYIIFIEVVDFAITDPKCPLLFQGKAKINFKVHDVKKDRVVFSEQFTRDFPADTPVSVSDVKSPEAFRAGFLRQVAKEMGWYVLPRDPGEVSKDQW